MHLTDAAWPEADAAETTVAVLPVGSTEQHGPHAPLGTDHLAATAVADAGTDAYDGEVVVAPPIPVGVAEEHRHFAGTLWLREDTFRAAIHDTVASLAHHGWTRVVVVNGHGGNTAPLREVCGRLTRDGTAYTVPFTWFDAVGTDDAPALPDDAGMGHAGAVETSLIRHLHAHLVDEDAFDAARENGADGWGEWQSGTNLAYDTAEFADSGVVGDPAQSSPEAGAQLLDAAAESLAALLDVVETREWSPTDD
jgi:creatinine amidohydrolase